MDGADAIIVIKQSTMAGKKRKSTGRSLKLAQSQARNTYWVYIGYMYEE
jgi:hypothetical protein